MTDAPGTDDPGTDDPGTDDPGPDDPGPDPRDGELGALVDRLPEGWSSATLRGRRYGVTKTTHADGRSLSVLAVELGGTDLVSANLYRTAARDVLRPCEMPAAKVIDFLRHAEPDAAPPAVASPEDRA